MMRPRNDPPAESGPPVKKLLAATTLYLFAGIALAILMAAGFALAIDLSQFRYTVF